MSYITHQDLLDELGEAKLIQFTDKERTGEVDWKVADKAISFAVGTFDSYARTRYTVPVPVTEKVRSICLDLAIYQLRRNLATTDEAITYLKKSFHDPAIKFLEALQSGKAALDVPAAEETAMNPATPDRVLKGTGKEQFSDKKLSSY